MQDDNDMISRAYFPFIEKFEKTVNYFGLLLRGQ